jgi:hypothetical protein
MDTNELKALLSVCVASIKHCLIKIVIAMTGSYGQKQSACTCRA